MDATAGLIDARIEALTAAQRKRLIGSVQKLAAQRRFFYRSRDCHPLSFAPIVLPRGLRPRLERLTRAFYRFQGRAPELRRRNAYGFADLARLERRTRAWFEAAAGRCSEPWRTLLRPDYGFTTAGELVLYELNSLMLGSLYIQTTAQSVVEERVLPGLGLSSRKLGLTSSGDLMRFFRGWLLASRRRAGFSDGGGIAFLEKLPPDGGFSELPQICGYFRSSGDKAAHGDPRALELRGDRVYLGDMPVSFVYRDFSFEDVGGPDNPRMKAFRRLWEEGRVVPGFPADFDQKGVLECLTSPAFAPLFTRAEAAAFREHVPWTRVMGERKTASADGRRVDLPEHARRERERLVLKPSWSAGGDGILIGRATSPARWERALERSLKVPGGYAVQAFRESERRRLGYLRDGDIRVADCRFTVGVFHGGGGFGFASRISPREVVNVARGGAMAAVYFR